MSDAVPRVDRLRFWFGVATAVAALLPSLPAGFFWFVTFSGVDQRMGSEAQATAVTWTAIAACLWLLAGFCVATSFERPRNEQR